MTKKYQSKISYALLIIVFVVFFSPIIIILIKDGMHSNLILTGIFLIVVYGFVLHMFFKTEYTIEDQKLKIKCGFIDYKPIEIKEMKSISKSYNIIASPAASFDRIEIKYGTFEELIISPRNKYEFAKHLKALNPELKNNITENYK